LRQLLRPARPRLSSKIWIPQTLFNRLDSNTHDFRQDFVG